MNSVLYALTTNDAMLTDGQASVGWWLHDVDGGTDRLHLQAMVASGDYFETLAARLEQIADAVPATCVEQHQLQDAIGQLIYLQRDYVIRKKG